MSEKRRSAESIIRETGGQGDKTYVERGVAISGPTFSDKALVGFVGLHGAVSIKHVMWLFDVGPTAAYDRVAACIEQGLLERLALLREEPSVLRATRAGLRYAGLSLEVATISLGSVSHWLRCTSTALWLAERYGFENVLTEREVRRTEQEAGRPVFSAKIGEHPDGSPRLHRPDLAILTEDRPLAVEVELSPKAPKRLESIMRAWGRAGWVEGVVYFCEAGATFRALERAMEKTHAEERVGILAVEER